MLKKLLATDNDWGQTVLRLAAGIVIWPHGAQKLLGLFGGYGLEGTLGFLTKMGIPLAFAWLAVIAEFFGGLALALGLFSRIAALGVFSTLAVALVMVHLPNGFFMNWSGNQKGEGIEYFLFALPVLALVVWRGAGAFSLDRLIAQKAQEAEPGARSFSPEPRLS
jgi:putative oxidoreductase